MEVVQLIRNMSDDYYKAALLHEYDWPSPLDLSLLVLVLENIRDPYYKNATVSSVASRTALEGTSEDVARIVQLIGDNYYRNATIAALFSKSSRLTIRGQFDDTLPIKYITDDYYKAGALATVATWKQRNTLATTSKTLSSSKKSQPQSVESKKDKSAQQQEIKLVLPTAEDAKKFDVATDDETQQCTICLERRKCTAIVDCGHTYMCMHCAASLATAPNANNAAPTCAICRTPITRVIRIHSV